jgi:dTDP-4-amino-4,6-dideoxygalactose transaminase
MGLMGCFSFYPTKNLGAFGDAGLVTTNDEALYVKLRQMRNHGMEPRYFHKFIGGNFRIDELQSAVLNVKIPHLESWHEARRRNADLYNRYFIESGLAEETGKTDFDERNNVLLPRSMYMDSGVTNHHIYNQYIIRIESRDDLRKQFIEKNIGSEIYYPVPFHRQECFAYLNTQDSDFPIANRSAAETLALPIFPELQQEQIEYVVQSIADYLKKKRES